MPEVTRDDIASKVIKIIADRLQKDEGEIDITESLHLDDDLGASSLDLFDVMTDLDEEFEIEIDEEADGAKHGIKFNKHVTIGQIISFIHEKLNEEDSN